MDPPSDDNEVDQGKVIYLMIKIYPEGFITSTIGKMKEGKTRENQKKLAVIRKQRKINDYDNDIVIIIIINLSFFSFFFFLFNKMNKMNIWSKMVKKKVIKICWMHYKLQALAEKSMLTVGSKIHNWTIF